jgi:hypothetical protein
MRRCPECLAAIVTLAVVVLTGATPAAAAHGPYRSEVVEYEVAFVFTDEDITESSGLLDAGPLMFTVNDSGDDPDVYAVDKRTGDTVAVMTYSSDDVDDVEAIAPAPDGDVWVADIGDNDEERSTIDVYRTDPLSDADLTDALDGGDVLELESPAEKRTLAYPDSAHNAETLLVHPLTGRLYVVTKEPGGGTVFEAPSSLGPDSLNELVEIGQLPGYLVDGAFFPDGRHVILRSYGSAAVYTFPGLREIGTLRLPPQRLGEGITVGAGGAIHLSSEGVFSEVLRILLPPDVARALGNSSPQTSLPGPSASPPPRSQLAEPPSGLSTEDGPGLWVAAGVFLLALVGWLAFTAAQRRSRRIP